MNDFTLSRFGVNENTLFEVLKNSPSAEGYLIGAIGEYFFKNYAERKGYEVRRIKEKPKGGNNAKKSDARGDFYIWNQNNKEDEGFVVECKSVKSNAEIWPTLKTPSSWLKILENHSIKRNEHIKSIYEHGIRDYRKAKKAWLTTNPGKKFPDFKWIEENPGPGVPDLSDLWKSKEEIKKWLGSFKESDFYEEAYRNLKAPVRLIQTHMPSTRTDELGIKRTGPLVSEFNILCLDLFLKTGEHEFVFVNSQDLNHQATSPNHLQQNYTIDILTAKDKFKKHKLLKPWYDDLDICINETNPIPRKIDKTQLDCR